MFLFTKTLLGLSVQILPLVAKVSLVLPGQVAAKQVQPKHLGINGLRQTARKIRADDLGAICQHENPVVAA